MDLPAADFNRLLDVEHGGIRPVALHEQMRIRAGSSYVPYIYDVLYQRAETPISFENYDFGLFSSFQDMFRVLNEKDEIYGMCRLCSGYAWEWTSKTIPLIPTSSSMEQRSGGTARPANGPAIPKPSWKWAAFIPSSVWT